MKLAANSLSKKYGRHIIFSNISFELYTGQSLGIIGKNGSGKSTLIKILISALSPSSGNTTFNINENTIPSNQLHMHIGVVSPYIHFYKNLSAKENILLRTKNNSKYNEHATFLLNKFDLINHLHSPVSTFSSGMVQRLRFVQALAISPSFVFLDEPSTALDESGKHIMFSVLNQVLPHTIVIMATNEPKEINYLENKVYLSRL